MNCLCNKGVSKMWKVEGDMSADPLYCQICGANLSVAELPISPTLADELISWSETYGTWIDWEHDTLYTHKLILEQMFNERGEELTKKLIVELGEDYDIIYVPSKSTSIFQLN